VVLQQRKTKQESPQVLERQTRRVVQQQQVVVVAAHPQRLQGALERN
jgi:pyrroline-5-carboxylate reductase